MQARDIFEKLGFEKIWGTATDQEPAYRYDFGNIQLTATQVTNLHFKAVFLLGGVARDERSGGMIDFQMPLEVESFEQGVAFIAYAIRDFSPQKPTPWLEQGRQCAELLPWVREMRMYEGRPHCSVDWEYFRVTVQKLREQLSSADPSEVVSFEFDGEVLRIKTPHALFAMPARGVRWDQRYFLQMSKLDFLPKRITHRPVSFSIWEGKICIGSRLFPLVNPDSLPHREGVAVKPKADFA
jgi:hypothetical protein